tara:strand:- start:153 stop:1052 length:900 start_codon:yes stop_codon:yes gene_type:complete
MLCEYQKPLPCSYSPSGEPNYMPRKWNVGSRNNVLRTHNCYAYMIDDLHNEARSSKPQPGYYHKYTSILNNRQTNNNRLSCSAVKKGVLLDNKHIKLLSIKDGKEHRCRPNHYKGLMMVSPGRDFHFARQDNRLLRIYDKIGKYFNSHNVPKTNKQWIDLFIKFIEKYGVDIINIIKENCNLQEDPKRFLRQVYNYSKTWSHKPGSTNVTDKDCFGKTIVNPLTPGCWNFSNKGGINYNNMCCFFEIPANYHLDTKSSGIPFIGRPSKEMLNKKPIMNVRRKRKDISIHLENILKRIIH